jgi:cation diffusion facilitator CzcD-associated flavoprotein CzcO
VNAAATDVDAIVVGAGVSGLYQLHRLRSLGLSVRVFEAGHDVGGTWYWNRYPGARFDSESYSYGYSFSRELVADWRWSEHFAAQPETLGYLQHVAERFDLRRDITFNARVTAATWDDGARSWTVALDDGSTHRARFVILAIGVLSVPKRPDIEGLGDFEGRCLHTGEWPHEPVDTTGCRVGVIGTGASAVQLITELAKSVGHLSVFQRTASWCAPLGNGPIDEETQRDVHARAEEIFERCRTTFGGFLHDSDRRKALEVSAEERTAFYEELYAQPGFAIWMGNFRDVLVNEEANATLSEFRAGKIRARVEDPQRAETLIPTDHGFGTRRVPLESGYYEAFNQPNVELIDLRREPIVRVTRRGIETSVRHYDLDVLVLATGFDAVTGPYERIDIRGIDGVTLRDAWAGGPRTYLGLNVAGFPNLFLLVGPHNAASFCNMPRCIEHNVDWLTTLIGEMGEKGRTAVCATGEGQDEWTAEVHEAAQRMLFSKVDSWFTGRNSASVPSGQRSVLLYAGGFPRYQERCADVAADGYRGFEFS